MKSFSFVLILTFLVGCKEEKTFADDIVLNFPKDIPMKTQEFNEDSNEGGENLLYIGKLNQNIEVKYYENLLSPPPPPPSISESFEEHSIRIKKLKDSLQLQTNYFFRTEEFPFLYSTNNDYIDSLSNKNLQIIVKESDTIPLYKENYNTKAINKYFAFPVFIKNISDKILRIPTESKSPALYIYEDSLNRFYFVRNSNYMICGTTGGSYSYIELKPNEILVYAYPYFKSGTKQKAKMKFYKAYSKDFQISIGEKILKNQYNKYYE